MNGEKKLLTIPEVAASLGIGRSLTYELVLKGHIHSVKLGRARRVPMIELDRYVAALIDASGRNSN